MNQSLQAILGRPPRILIVDDDEDLLLVMNLTLKSEGFDVQVSFNAEGFFEILQNYRPDVILLDITMDGIEGGALCMRVKADADTRGIIVFMFSANRNVEQIAQVCGAEGFVTKPFEMADLHQKIRDSLGAFSDKK